MSGSPAWLDQSMESMFTTIKNALNLQNHKTSKEKGKKPSKYQVLDF